MGVHRQAACNQLRGNVSSTGRPLFRMRVSLRIGDMQLAVIPMRIHTIIRAVSFALLTMAGYVPGFANVQSLCKSCEV